VEDNDVNQKVFRKQLERLQCHVTVAGHGVEALNILGETKWFKGNENGKELDVLLMDLEMPVMGGLECLRRIREMEARGEIIGHVPSIVVSANARRKQVEQAEKAGTDDFISKPFRINELVPKMVRLVKS
jgi:CheY-like chemotaxis protein